MVETVEVCILWEVDLGKQHCPVCRGSEDC